MSFMSKHHIWLLFVCYVSIASAQDWKQALQERDRWAENKTFVYTAETTMRQNNSVIAPELPHLPTEVQRSLRKLPAVTKRKTKAVLTIARKGQNCIVLYEILSSERYPVSTLFLFCKPKVLMVLSQTPQSHSQTQQEIRQSLSVYPTSEEPFSAGFPTLLAGNDELVNAPPSFLAGYPPNNCFVPFGWSALGERLSWEGKKDAKGEVWLELRGVEGIRATMRLAPTYRFAVAEYHVRSNGMITYHARVTKWQTVEGWSIPKEVIVVDRGRAHEMRTLYRLSRIIPTEGKLDPPKGIRVADFRLSEQVYDQPLGRDTIQISYTWNGRLPTIEELEQMAQQQGNPLPPGTPHRRYSLVMFAPAVIFLLIADYLFWKGRKK